MSVYVLKRSLIFIYLSSTDSSFYNWKWFDIFGTLYYAASVWLNTELKEAQWNRLNSIHYRVIRATICDYKKKVPRTMLNIISKRATPKQWAQYTIAKTVIKLFNKGDTRIGALLRQNSYVNDRNPGRATFFEDAKMKIGRNWLFLTNYTFLTTFDLIGLETSVMTYWDKDSRSNLSFLVYYWFFNSDLSFLTRFVKESTQQKSWLDVGPGI